TAGNLRANCAAALVRIGYPEVLFELVGLVMDPEVEARRGAVRALVRLGAEESELLLRMKALARDAEADVLGECFSGLMNMAPERSLPFVARYLDDADLAVAECAALAIGESRTPEAFATLRRAWDNDLRREFRQMLLLPLALTRQDDAFDFLLDILREAQRDAALAALDALRLYAGDPGRADTVRRIVECRKDARLSRAYVEAFQPAT
ncbi:MAG TPA: HEAT repeat domain-containing protein, partial [Candidatus Hydrogenedentes bacterium]|nr:HEAT repeat domain-containing protein [Candidatus Hydrogenedentota bacterium]